MEEKKVLLVKIQPTLFFVSFFYGSPSLSRNTTSRAVTLEWEVQVEVRRAWRGEGLGVWKLDWLSLLGRCDLWRSSFVFFSSQRNTFRDSKKGMHENYGTEHHNLSFMYRILVSLFCFPLLVLFSYLTMIYFSFYGRLKSVIKYWFQGYSRRQPQVNIVMGDFFIFFLMIQFVVCGVLPSPYTSPSVFI